MLRVRWEVDLYQEMEYKEWQATHRYMRRLSCNVALCTFFYKLRSRWYLAPVQLHKMRSLVNSQVLEM